MELLVRIGDAPPSRLHGEGVRVIGRDLDDDLVVDDPLVSRRHARLEVRGAIWWLVDTSTNGTFDERGAAVTEVAIDGDREFRLGSPDGSRLRLTPTTPQHLPTVRHLPPDDSTRPRASAGFDPRPDTLLIGRSPECDLVLPSVSVSRRHASLTRVASGWCLRDLDSANGTFVDGERVSEAFLSAGAVVSFGQHETVFGDGGFRDSPVTSAAAIDVSRLQVSTDDGTVIVQDVSFAAPPGTLTAVLGPTGAGKSTVLKALTGSWIPSSGAVVVDGRDLYDHFEELRLRIGYVPQDDIVHMHLTVRQALSFGAELRLPDDTTAPERDVVIDRVCAELGLTDHVHKRIAQLSGGQRKRVSVALELLTEPDLLFLDEPTSGLDPGYEAALMQMFRQIADTGRTVVVVTHSTSSLDLCHQVVFLGTGGWVGYAGPPAGALGALHVADHPSAFRSLESPNPNPRPALPTRSESTVEPSAGSYPTGFAQQFMTLVRRSVALLAADPRALGVLAASAVIPAVLLAILVGNDSLSADQPLPASSARTLLTGIIISAGVIGAANGLREIVKELPIYHRERAAGLRRGPYLLSKVVVLGSVTATQATLLTVVATLLSAPGWGNLLPGQVELIAVAVLTAVVSLMFGLCISAFVTSSEKALALIPVVFVVFWLFSGSVSDLADKAVLNQLAYAAPSNWGMAAAASSADLLGLEQCGHSSAAVASTAPAVCDARWGHSFLQWTFNLLALSLLGGVALLGADWALARKESLPYLRNDHAVGRAWRAVRSLRDSTPG